MSQPRVFEIANAHGIDVRTVLDALRALGETEHRSQAQLSEALARKVRVHLNGGRPIPEENHRGETTRCRSMFARALHEQRDDAIRRIVPGMAVGLQSAAAAQHH